MQKIEKTTDGKYIFYCPGCKCHHWFTTPRWQFNGDLENPTVSPSIRISIRDKSICHFHIENGKIEYLDDCIHELRNKVVEMEDATI